MATESIATEHAPTASEYIVHHLTHLQTAKPKGLLDLSVINFDSLFFSTALCVVCLFFLSYPQTTFTIITVTGPSTFHIGLGPTMFTIIMFTMGIAFALGKASVFKYISDDYPKNIGVVSGVVGLVGGMGGFLMPIMFGALVDLTGIRSSAFMLMFGVVWVSLMWMYFTEVRPLHAAQEKIKAA